jgi:hypothetical protein
MNLYGAVRLYLIGSDAAAAGLAAPALDRPVADDGPYLAIPGAWRRWSRAGTGATRAARLARRAKRGFALQPLQPRVRPRS